MLCFSDVRPCSTNPLNCNTGLRKRTGAFLALNHQHLYQTSDSALSIACVLCSQSPLLEPTLAKMMLKSASAARTGCLRPQAVSRRVSVRVRADKCLIVNTKGGGHAFIGLYLAKELVSKGHDVTIFQQGDEVCILQHCGVNGVRVAKYLYWIRW